jgi:hypothetical protein
MNVYPPEGTSVDASLQQETVDQMMLKEQTVEAEEEHPFSDRPTSNESMEVPVETSEEQLDELEEQLDESVLDEDKDKIDDGEVPVGS